MEFTRQAVNFSIELFPHVGPSSSPYSQRSLCPSFQEPITLPIPPYFRPPLNFVGPFLPLAYSVRPPSWTPSLYNRRISRLAHSLRIKPINQKQLRFIKPLFIIKQPRKIEKEHIQLLHFPLSRTLCSFLSQKEAKFSVSTRTNRGLRVE